MVAGFFSLPKSGRGVTVRTERVTRLVITLRVLLLAHLMDEETDS